MALTEAPRRWGGQGGPMGDGQTVEDRLERIEAEQVAVRAEMRAGFARIDARLGDVPTRDEVLKMIRAEGVETRRHFDIVAEKFKADVALLGEAQETVRQRVDRIEEGLWPKRS